MIDYRYNEEKQIIVAFFCDDVSKKFEGKKYWYKNICSSLWKIFLIILFNLKLFENSCLLYYIYSDKTNKKNSFFILKNYKA